MLAVLIARPFVEMGVNDDWAFAHMALVASRTWRLQYDGWTQPLVGCQAYWGAVFIKVFGFSFTLLRLSLLPFVAGAAVLQFCLARQTGLRRSFAVFAAMTVALSRRSTARA